MALVAYDNKHYRKARRRMNELAPADSYQLVVNLVIDGLDSPHSRRAYQKALVDFLTWWEERGRPGLSKALVQEYRLHLAGQDLAPSTINQRISAVRRLAQEAADNGLLPQDLANGIAKVRGVKSAGVRSGNWLLKRQAEQLIGSPDTTTLKGLRDRAMLSLMIGAGLRRSEVAALEYHHLQQREGRWVVVDLMGKGRKVRTVPIPSWCKAAIDSWTEAAGLSSGPVFRRVYHYGLTLQPGAQGISAQAVYDAVEQAAYDAGLQVAPHDLRRTFAKLARKGGAELSQIQLTLGHASVATTQRYIGEEQNLTDAPCDRLGLSLG